MLKLMVKHSHGSWNRTASILLVTAVNHVHCMLVLNENLPCTLQFIAGLLRQHYFTYKIFNIIKKAVFRSLYKRGRGRCAFTLSLKRTILILRLLSGSGAPKASQAICAANGHQKVVQIRQQNHWTRPMLWRASACELTSAVVSVRGTKQVAVDSAADEI